jgi:hypothetical protein
MSLGNWLLVLTSLITIIPLLKMAKEHRFGRYNVTIVLLGLAILVVSILKGCEDDKNQNANTITINSLNRSVGKMQGIINGNQAANKAMQKQLNGKADSLNEANKLLVKASGEIIATQREAIGKTQKVADLAVKNSELQAELLRQANSSKSIPLLSAAIVNLQREDPDYEGDGTDALRFVVTIKNIGKYDLDNIKVRMRMGARHLGPEQQIGDFHLSAGDTLKLRDDEVSIETLPDSYPVWYEYTIAWKTYRYKFGVALPLKPEPENDTKVDLNTNSLHQYYWTEDIGTQGDKEKFVQSMLKKIK